MTSFLSKFLATSQRSGDPLSLDAWAQYFNFNSNTYQFGLGSGNYTLGGRCDEINQDFTSYVHAAYRFNGIVFACMLARLMLFSEARFQFRQIRNGRPGDLFGTEALMPLEKPWPNGTTGDLLTRMMQDADLSGNSYIARPGRTLHPTTGKVLKSGADQLFRMRPDWVTIVGGSRYDPGAALSMPDAEVLGYMYHPGGRHSGNDPVLYTLDEVAHFAPIPDPCSRWIGMSWLTPILREVQADSAAMQHKLQYFELGATPNLVVSMDPTLRAEAFKKWVAEFADKHEGPDNAYRTMYLGGGATAQVVGNDMKSIDFSAVQGHGETRIASAAGVPPIIVGLSEGLAAATYSNYGQARRAFSDGTMRPLWRNASASLQTLIDTPGQAELWYDGRDIAFLQEDLKDAAEIQSVHAAAIKGLTEAGYTPESSVAAVMANDLSQLVHSGLYSVQLQSPGSTKMPVPDLVDPTADPNGTAPKDVPADPAAAGLNDVGRVVRALLPQN